MLLRAAPNPRVAVILNPNARGVRPEVVERLGRLVPENDLFVSQSLDHSREIARTIVDRAYDGVLVGGGDGTFVQCLSDLNAHAQALDVPLPKLGVLRLGTGNALADALEAGRPTAHGLVRDLRRARMPGRGKTLPLLNVDGRLTPFAGCGLDAQILEDYRATGRALDRIGVGKLLGASARYAIAVGAVSVPRYMLRENPEVEVVNRGAPAFPIDTRTGKPRYDQPIYEGQLVFRGRVGLCSGSTIPYFGLKLKMFPYADLRRDRFQLRCATSSALEAIAHLPGVFAGEYRSPTLNDFLCEKVEVRIDRAVPFQVGGDLCEGTRDHFELTLAEQPVEVLA